MKYLKFLLLIALLCLCLAACQKECAHAYQREVTLAPSCSQEGTETFTCALCGDSYTKPLAALTHKYGEEVVELAATCTQEGHTVATCENCGQTKQSILEKLPHTLADATVTKEPTCAQEGERTGICSVCNTENLVEVIPTNDAHSFENTVIREATCTDPGEGLDTCTLCGHTQNCTYDYKEHSFKTTQIVTAATCTAEGKKTVTCSECGKIEDRSISPAGHKWTGATCQKEGFCSVCNAIGKKADHDYEITRDTGSGSKYYAQEVHKKCKTCGFEKKLYYANKVEFDLDAIRDTLEEYARGYGFVNIVYEIDDSIIASQKSHKAFDVFKTELYKDPIDHFTGLGKQLIDFQYDAIKNSTYPMEKRELQLTVTYSSSGSLGGGFFHINVARTTID